MTAIEQSGYGLFKCARCGKTYEKDRSDAEAEKEKDLLFPDDSIEDCAIICGDCWTQGQKLGFLPG